MTFIAYLLIRFAIVNNNIYCILSIILFLLLNILLIIISKLLYGESGPITIIILSQIL